MERITVVMTTYNGEKYIEEQFLSILNQTILPDEIVISDDLSSDNTVSVLRRLKDLAKNIDITIIENKENQGYIRNFRSAILKAKGEYIFLCDQDDIWEKEKIQKTIETMKKYKSSFACTGLRLIDAEGNFIDKLDTYKSDPICGYENWSSEVKTISLKQILWGNFSPGCTYCFTKRVREIYSKIVNNEIAHDFQLFLISANSGGTVFIDQPLSRYRLHDSNAIGMNQKEAKRTRHFQPRIIRFLLQLSQIMPVQNLFYAKVILYLRLPKIKSIIIHKLGMRWEAPWK